LARLRRDAGAHAGGRVLLGNSHSRQGGNQFRHESCDDSGRGHQAVQRCIETAKRKGSKNLADEFIQEGERLATEKRQVELEREKLKIDIRYKEKVVTDARIIAGTLKQFEHVIRKLSDEEQKELIRLLVKEITVNHFDPEKDEDPSGVGVFKAKIRTRWYLVNISLYGNDLFTGVPEGGVKSSYLDLIGSPDCTQLELGGTN
jgi:hypothetical protein